MAAIGKVIVETAALERVIGVQAVAFTAFNCIVGAGIFGLPALVAAVLGPAAILAYLICLILIACVGQRWLGLSEQPRGLVKWTASW